MRGRLACVLILLATLGSGAMLFRVGGANLAEPEPAVSPEELKAAAAARMDEAFKRLRRALERLSAPGEPGSRTERQRFDPMLTPPASAMSSGPTCFDSGRPGPDCRADGQTARRR